MSQSLLSVQGLKLNFYTYAGVVEALDGVTFNVHEGETVALVGETGCGKSVTALSIMRLVPRPGKIVGGEIFFKGEDLLQKAESSMRKVRGKKISMIFQDPMTYLNPVFTIGEQITEVLMLHEDERALVYAWKHRNEHGGNPEKLEQATLEKIPETSMGGLSKPGRGERKKSLRWRAIQMLSLVRMPDPEKIFYQYPHELSGGMRQRAIIAMMLSTRPALLIADEPTTALDVTIQAQVLHILRDLKTAMGLSMIFITHDLGIVAENCDTVNVMYAGRIAESGSATKIFANPQHPYTQGLMKSLPKVTAETDHLTIIQGSVPSLIHPPTGCRFHPRCPYAMDICSKQVPDLLPTEEDHKVSCFLYHEGA